MEKAKMTNEIVTLGFLPMRTLGEDLWLQRILLAKHPATGWKKEAIFTTSF